MSQNVIWTMSYNNSQRDIQIDLIRVVACLSVVLLHVTATFWYSTPVRYLELSEYYVQQSNYLSGNGVCPYASLGWYICSFIDTLTRFSVPSFVMVSGALVLNKTEIPTSYLKRKIIHVSKIILCWGLIIGWFTISSSFVFSNSIPISQVLRIMVNGNGVFWFLYMLLPLYLVSPILKLILDNQQACKLFVLLWFVLSIILPFAESAIPALCHNVNLEYMSLFSAYTGYFLIGGYLYRHDDIKIPALLGGLVISILLMTVGRPAGLWHNFTTPFCVIMSVSFFLKLKEVKVHEKRGKLITIIAKQSMGIYGLHIFFLKTIKTIWPPYLDYWYIQILVYYIVVVVLSFALSKLIKLIPVFKDI